MHAAWDGDRIVGGAGRVHYSHVGSRRRVGPGRGVTVVGVLPTHRRRGVLTALMRGAARGLPRARRRGRVPLGVRGDDLRPLRLRPGLADRIDRARAGSHAVRRPVRGTRNGAAGRPRRSGGCLPAAVRAAPCAAAGHVHAKQGLVGDAQALRRPGTAARGRTAQPGAARARRRAGRLRPLPRQAGLGSRLQQGDGDDSSRSSRRRPRPRASSGAGSSTSTGRRQFIADLLPLDHPLVLLLAEPRRMQFTINDGVWVRLLDVEAALSAPHVHGRRGDRARRRRFVPAGERRPLSRHAAGAERTKARCRTAARRRRARLGLPRRLRLRRSRARGTARRAEPGAIARADALFRTDVDPWCAEIF